MNRKRARLIDALDKAIELGEITEKEARAELRAFDFEQQQDNYD